MVIVQISIILIDRDGEEYLRQALRGLRRAIGSALATVPELQAQLIEFVLVDNGSTDSSLAIAEEEMGGLECHWETVNEPEPGVNFARLAGLRAARGDYLIFTDNDLEFEPHWLAAYLRAFAAYPDCRVFAGRVLVGNVEGVVPKWLDLVGPWSRPSIVPRCDNGGADIVGSLGDNALEGPVGGNMAFQRTIFEDYGLFDTSFGLRPGSLVPGAEAEFLHRLAKRGEEFVYVAGACVYHPLKRHQISKSYFRRRMHGVGRATARMQRLDGTHNKRLFGVRCFRFRQLLEAWLAYAVSCVGGCPRKRFFQRCEISKLWGQIVEDLATRRLPVSEPVGGTPKVPMAANRT